MTALSLPKSESEFKEWLLELVRTLDAIVEQKDPLLRNHSKRVANNCANFCEVCRFAA
jgi:response regulator RpfG family c-di-GMP phosphodiesterase